MAHESEGYGAGAVAVSCHVERPLDDETWRRFSELQRRRPGGLAVAALLRPPDEAAGERWEPWLERARAAAGRGPLGHHTHWTAPGHARPTGGDPAARVLDEGERLRAEGVPATLFCGGGWYTDAGVAEAAAALGYADCTPTAFRPSYLEPGARRAQLDAPARLRLPSGALLTALPSTHSLGAAARLALRRLPRWVHVYFHDTDLLDARRRLALVAALAALGRRGRAVDLDALVGVEAPERPLAEVLEGSSPPAGIDWAAS
ncbi:MAG TPA: hypothetical protein VLB86_03635 [Gaiellaceae bacterium]|nr:hypothetical protein [Gaiellaceae bacterium]